MASEVTLPRRCGGVIVCRKLTWPIEYTTDAAVATIDPATNIIITSTCGPPASGIIKTPNPVVISEIVMTFPIPNRVVSLVIAAAPPTGRCWKLRTRPNNSG